MSVAPRSSSSRGQPHSLLLLLSGCLILALSSTGAHALVRTHYEVLDVDRNATKVEIKKAYRSLSLQYHPDKNRATDASDRFNEIAEAYEVLSDEDKRAEYDESFEMMFKDLTADFGSFLQNAWSLAKEVWGQVREELEVPFNSALCYGLDISVFDPVVSIFESFWSTAEEDGRAVILEQQYPGLALGEEIAQAWLTDHLCASEDRIEVLEGGRMQRVTGRTEPTPESAFVVAAALLFWMLRGKHLMALAAVFTLALANCPTEWLPFWREPRDMIGMPMWAVDAKVPLALAMGYLVFLQVALVFLLSLPLHILHRAGLASALAGIVSTCFSTALLALSAPLWLARVLEVSVLKLAAPVLALLGASRLGIGFIQRPANWLLQSLLALWLWVPVTAFKIAEGFVLLVFGMGPFTEHPKWMFFLRAIALIVCVKIPNWLLNKTGTLISYFLIASLLFMYAATLNHALDDLTLLGGTLINLGGAVALWGIRAAAVHIFLLPL